VETRKASTIIRKGVNEMEYTAANTTLNLCYDRLQELEEVKCLIMTLKKYDITYLVWYLRLQCCRYQLRLDQLC
jgi:hypothetical protein